MSGPITGPTPSITQWVQKLDNLGVKDSAQFRGSEKVMHLRTGFETFKEGLQSLFSKKDPAQHDGVKARVYEGIKNDFGKDIADKVFANYRNESSVSAGDIRSMLNEARVKQFVAAKEKLEGAVGANKALTNLDPSD